MQRWASIDRIVAAVEGPPAGSGRMSVDFYQCTLSPKEQCHLVTNELVAVQVQDSL